MAAVAVEPLHSPAINGTSAFASDANTTLNGNGTHPALVLDPTAFKSYLLALVPALLGATLDELEVSLFDPEFEDRVARFSTESGGAIYVSKLKNELEGTIHCYSHPQSLYVVLKLLPPISRRCIATDLCLPAHTATVLYPSSCCHCRAH